MPQGAHRAPLVGSLKVSSGHRWDRREAWEKPPHASRHPQWSLHSGTFWHVDNGHPQYPTVSSSAGFSSGFDPKEESSVLRWQKYALDGSKPSLPPFRPHGSRQGSCTTPAAHIPVPPSSPMMPQLQEPGPCPCPPQRPHGQPLPSSRSCPPAAFSLLTAAPPELAAPFRLCPRLWCSPKGSHHLQPPPGSLTPECPIPPSFPVGLGAPQPQICHRASTSTTNTDSFPVASTSPVPPLPPPHSPSTPATNSPRLHLSKTSGETQSNTPLASPSPQTHLTLTLWPVPSPPSHRVFTFT